MRSRWLNIFVLLSLLLGTLPLTVEAAPAAEPAAAPVAQETPDIEVEDALRAQLAADETTGYLIYFKEEPDLSPAYEMDWIERGRFVANALNQAALHSQADVRAYLDAQGIEYKAFWIDNVISVESSNRATFDGLMKYAEIKALRQHRQLSLIDPQRITTMAPSAPQAIEPNILHVLADQVWAQGYTGEGIVVANLDTGVRYTHDALVDHYRGNLGSTFDHNYNWWDPTGYSPTEPGDDHGHGSHTMGTMVGDDGGANQIGMAPGAQWMACRGCTASSGCPGDALLECAQFFAAPWDLNQANANPDMRPNAVNNSWGDCAQSYDDWYRDVVDAWQAAGIYPIFSNGNAGNCSYPYPPGLNTVGNPARYGNVTGVGSTGRDNGQYATHSNWGPTDDPDTVNPKPGWEYLKPQVLAPGVNIRSSTPGSDSEYQGGWGGTSMSAPHVTGLIALMWSAAPCLIGDYATTETIIEDTATPIPYDDGTGGGATVPNQATGWGEINALAAVEAAAASCGDSAITGEVLDAATNATIEGVSIVATNAAGTVQRKAASNAAGVYVLNVFSDTYTLSASRYGYQTTMIADVVATSGATTTQHIALTPAAFYEVSGQVTDAATGWPLYAHISISGDPVGPAAPDNSVWTDPATGEYSLMLAEGVTYTFAVEAWVAGYSVATDEVGPLTADAPNTDFALQADMGSCAAPGYYLTGGLMASFEDDAFPPAGWTVVNNGGACTWVGNDPGGDGNLTGGSGKFADADSDSCGSGTTMNTDLISPPFDVSGLSQINLSFAYDYYNLSSSEVAAVDVSADGGATWVNVVTWNSSHRGPATFSQDVTALLTGSTQARVRFHYYAPGWDWWWQVDDVVLGNPVCNAPADGGLVVGNVYDENYPTVALNGAEIVNAAGYAAESVPTPLDAAVDDAFYTVFAPSGAQVFTATMQGYGPDTATVTVVDGDTVEQGFQLPAGMLDATPDGVAVTVELGFTDSASLNLGNTGSVAAAFELKEHEGRFAPIHIQAYTGNLPADDTPVSTGLAPHKTAPAAETSAPLAFPLADAAPAFAIDLDASELGTFMSDAPGVWTTIGGIGLGGPYAGDFLNGDFSQMYVVDYDTNGFYVIDTATGVATLIGTSTPQSGQSWTGMAGSADGTLYAASTNGSQSYLYTVDPATGATTVVGEITNAPIIIAIAVNADGQMYGVDIGSDVLVAIDPATGAGTVVGSTGLSANYAQGMDFEEESGVLYWAAYGSSGELRIIDTATGASTSVGAFPGGDEVDCLAFATGGAADVPWLAETPVAGSVPAAGNTPIGLAFDAAYVDQPGEYHAELIVKNDTPYGKFNIPVTMTVTAPQSWGKLTGAVTGLGVCDGDPAPLEEAEVFVESATTGQTWLVTTDVSGTYHLWIDQAHSPLTVTVTAPDYFGETGGVVVQQGQTTVVNFDLRILLPCLSYDPADFDVTLDMGANTVEPLTLSNTGAAAAEYEMVEKPGGFIPVSRMRVSSQVSTPRERLAGYDPDAATTEGILAAGGTPAVGILAAGDVLAQWPTGMVLPWGTGFSLDDQMVWVNDNAAGGGSGLNEEFDVAGNRTGASFTPNFGGTWPGDIAYNPNTGMFWQVNVGGDNCIYEWDPSIPAATGNSICGGAWSATSQRGLAYDPTTDTFFIGGWNEYIVYHIDNTGSVIEQWNLGISISGLAYNFEAGYLFIMENTATDTITVFDVASGSVVDTFTVSGFGNYAGAGLAIDCDGNLWAPNQINFNAYLIDSGVPANLCASVGGGIPWLTEDPISGTIPMDTDALVDFTFDAGVPETMQPGTYYGALKVNSNAANEVHNIPVTLTVTAPATWGKVAGVVTGLGYCDVATPTLLEEAEVTVESGTGLVEWLLLTDENGAYQLWLDAAHSPVDITIAYPDHTTQVFNDVVVTAGATTTRNAALRWAMPCLSVAPDMFDVTVTLGTSATVPFTLTNAGAGAAAFDLAEANGGATPLLPQLLSPSVAATDGTSVSLLQFGESNVTVEGSVVSPHFSEEDILLDQAPNQDNGIFSDAGCDGCTTGAQVVAENFSLDAEETIGHIVLWSGYYSTDTPIDPDHLTVIFHADASGSPGTTLSTETDVSYEREQTGVVLFGVHEWMHTLTLANPVTLGPGTYWVEIYNDTGTGTDDFFWETGAADTVGNGLTGSAWATQAPGSSWNLDTATEMFIQLIRSTSGSGGDIPWLSEDPASGAVDADDTFVVDLTFDASEAVTQVTGPGEYFGTLRVNSDDPVNDKIVVPVTMTVVPPATWGKLMGAVTGLGYCDADPAPVAGAQVLIENSSGMTWTVTTNVSGTYQLWLEADTLTLTVEVPDHEKGEAVVTLAAGATMTEDFDLRLLAPCVEADPLALHATLELGATATEVLTLTNTGAADTDWNAVEENLGAPTGTEPGVVTIWTEGFEGAFPPAGWVLTQTGATNDPGWEQTTARVYNGTYATYHDDFNSDGTSIAWIILPQLTVPAGGTLSFWQNNNYSSFGEYHGLWVSTASNDPADFVELFDLDMAPEGNWGLMTVDLSAYVGQSVYLAFRYEGDYADEWYIDDVSLQAVDAVTWLAETPTSGALVADTGAQVVDVDFDASVTGIDQPGDYLANLWINSDDPTAPIILPVTMTVTPPASWGQVVGTVSSLGRCDVMTAALAGAEVVIWDATATAVVTLTTGISGTYSYWLPNGAYTVTVAAADHVGASAVVAVLASTVVTQDFNLIWLGPCVSSIAPSAMEVTVALGMSTTLPLTMTNAGAGALNYLFSEENGSFVSTLRMPVQQAVQLSSVIWNPEKLAGECAIYQDSTLVEPAEARSCYDSVPEPSVFNMPMSPSDIGYALEMYSTDTLVTFPLNNFTGQTVVGAISASYYGVDFDPTATTLYALNDTTDQLGTIDLTTGAFTALVPCAPGGGADSWTGLTIDPITGVFYGSTATALFVINPATGASTLVGNFGTTLMIDIAMNTAGQMYGHDIGTDSIYQINPATGAATLIGATGYAANYAQGMDFDNNDGTLYIFLYQGGGANVFGTVNLATGAVTPLSVSSPLGEFEGAIQVPGAVPIPWLFEDPVSGAVPAMAAGTADIIFDAGVSEVTQPGTYAGVLTVNNDDPVWDGYSIPVTMHVTLPATYGQITGTVMGLGPCDDPATAEPLEGAEVMIQSATQTWTLLTDADGGYALWLDESHSPVSIMANAADYVPSFMGGVVVTAGVTTVQGFALHPLAPCLSVAPADAHVTVAMGLSATLPITVGNTGMAALDWQVKETDEGFAVLGPLAAGGPDAFGYTFADSTEADGPAYDWVDITSSGTAISGLTDDSYGGPFDIGFAFNFYGNDYTQFYVGSNGILTFGSGSSSLSNQNLPNTATPNNLVALMWDDMYPNYSTGGVYYQSFATCPYGGGQACAILEFQNWAHCCSATNSSGTWQAILFENGSILVQYEDVGSESGLSATSGIENSTGTIGLTYIYETATMVDNSAVCFAYPDMPTDCSVGDAVPWLDEDPTSGTVALASTGPVTLTFDASVPEVTQPGDYYATLTFKGGAAELAVPVTMTVEPPATWGKIGGLVQGLGYCNAITMPLEGAVIFVESTVTTDTWAVETDAAGIYGIWFDESYSPFTVTISYEAGYDAQVFTNVAVNAGETTPLNADLLFMGPCMTVAPDALAFSVPMGTSTTVALDLENLGAGNGTFLVNEASLGVDPLGPLAAGGPDDFGYRFADSNQGGIAPTYAFVDIADVGAPVALGDNDFEEVSLGFAFKFYGDDAADPDFYNTVFVNSNGFLSFGAGSTDISPDALPSPTLPDALIAVAWDDLKPGVGGTVYVESFAQCPYNPLATTVDACFIAQYTNFVHADDTPAGTFEVILFHTGSILMQYADVDAPDAGTGIEGPLGLSGLNYGPALADELAICFAYPDEWLDCQSSQVSWLSVDPAEGALAAHTGETLAVVLDATVPEVSEPGVYMAQLTVSTNDLYASYHVIPVTMTVGHPADMVKLAGIVTAWGQCDAVSETLAGVQVAIATSSGESFILTTDATGAYATWVPLDDTYTMTVSYPGYVPVTFVGAVETMMQPRNVDLRADLPCVSLTPTSFDVTLPKERTVTRTLTIHNAGAGDFAYDDISGLSEWLTVSPAAGVVPGNDEQDVTLIFDATGLANGDVYSTVLEIAHLNTAVSRLFVRPVRMTVLDEPVVLVDVAKMADPADFVLPGGLITYTVVFTNSYDRPLVLTATDFIPADTTYVPMSVSGGAVFADPTGDAITWHGSLEAGASTTFSYAVEVGADVARGALITNTVTIEAAGLTFTADAVVLVGPVTQYIYLPLVMRAAP